MSRGVHQRAGLVGIALALVLSIYSGRLIYLQVGKHEEFKRAVADTTARKKIVPAERGKITDVRGEVLADNVPIYAVVADGTLLTDRAPTGPC